MKEYKDIPEEGLDKACEPAVAYEVEVQADSTLKRILKIPRDENGKPIGTPWEEVLNDIYDDLSKHYGVDLRTL